MTCIAALIDKAGTVHMASDSVGSNGRTKSNYLNQKIFRKGDMLIGYTSSYRMGQLLEHSLTLPQRKVGQSLDAYMYVDFVEEVRKVMKNNGFLSVDGNVESIGTFMIGVEGRLFKMQSDLAILESQDRFDACGSGEDYAVASIDVALSHSKLAPRAILETAITIASKYVTTVGGEIRYLNSMPEGGDGA